jgi:hypothetical protein
VGDLRAPAAGPGHGGGRGGGHPGGLRRGLGLASAFGRKTRGLDARCGLTPSRAAGDGPLDRLDPSRSSSRARLHRRRGGHAGRPVVAVGDRRGAAAGGHPGARAWALWIWAGDGWARPPGGVPGVDGRPGASGPPRLGLGPVAASIVAKNGLAFSAVLVLSASRRSRSS